MKISDLFKKHEQEGTVDTIEIWRDRWDTKTLENRHKELGDRAFYRGYMHEAYTDEDTLFPNFYKILKPVSYSEVITKDYLFFTGVDISTKSRAGKIISTIAVHKLLETIIQAEVKRIKGGTDIFVKEIIRTYDRFDPEVIYVENNAIQEIVIEWFEKEKQYARVEGYLTGKQKFDEVIGLPSFDIEFKNGQWTFPDQFREGHETETCHCAYCEYVKEFTGYPNYDTNDIVMATWFARQASRKYFGYGEDSMHEQEPVKDGVMFDTSGMSEYSDTDELFLEEEDFDE